MQTPVKIPFITLAQEAASETTLCTRLQELALQNIELARVVAANAVTDGELLGELSCSEDRETRQAVASNPNTPTDVLFKLGVEFPQELLDNVVFSLLLLENPNLASDIPEDTLASLLKLATVPDAFIEWGLTRKRSQIMFAVAMNPKIGKDALQTLIEEAGKHWTTARVPKVASLHVNWASEMTAGWEEAAFAVVRKQTSKRDNIEHHLASEPSLWEIGVIPETFLTALHPNSLREIARNPEASPHALEMLLSPKVATKKVRVAIAGNLNTPVHILEKLAGDEDEGVRRTAFQNPSTPTPVYQLFHKYESAIANPQADAATLSQIATSKWAKTCQEVAFHRNTPISVLVDFANHKYWKIRAAVARNPNLPINLLEQLARDKRLGVRQAVVLNPNTSATLLTRLLKDKNWDLRCKIARHPNVTPVILATLARDNHACVRIAVTENPQTPIETLTQLAVDSDYYVRKYVAQNTRTPEAVLMRLAEDSSYMVRQRVARNPNTLTWVLAKLAADDIIPVRLEVAQNVNTSDKVLTYLEKDAADWVGIAAIETRKKQQSCQSKDILPSPPPNYFEIATNPATPIQTLLELAKISLSEIKNLIIANLCQKIALTDDISHSDLLEVCTELDSVDLKIAIARHPHACASTLQKFASSPSFRLRRLVAQNPNLPPNLIEKLLQDKNLEVRRAALRGFLNQVQASKAFNSTLNDFLQQWQSTQNPDTSSDTLIQLASSKWIIIREAVALHPQAAMTIFNPENTSKYQKTNVPVTLLEKLADDKHLVVKIAVAKNPDVPLDILEQLTYKHHCHSLVHIAAVKTLSKHYPKHAGLFFESYIFNIPFASISRFFILINSLTPSDLLIKHYRSSSWLERYAIATNPNTPSHIREHLAQDANRIVRAAAKANLES